MAYRRKSYTYWDGDAIFPIPFEYLEQDDILVFINDEQTSDFVIENTQVKLNNIPTEVPAIIKIVSATDIDKAIVDWENVSSLDEDNLILSDNQIRYAVQELYDNTEQFKVDINNTLSEVNEAARVINTTIATVNDAVITAQGQATIATEQANIATEQANIAIEKAELTASTANKALEDLETLTSSALSQITTEGAEQIANIESTGFYMRDDKLYFIDSKGEEQEFQSGGSGFNLFDTKISDQILEGEEALGWALQGTFVNGAVYPDFYAECVKQYNESTKIETINNVTIKVNSNGHKFYDIANLTAIDDFYNSMGVAWFYGVDTENERVFLPRNNYFAVVGGADTVPVYGNGHAMMLTDGTSSFNIVEGGASAYAEALTSAKGNEGLPVGSSATGSSINTKKVTGLVTSGDSGLIVNTSNILASDETKYLYICVGNTVINEKLVDVGKVMKEAVLRSSLVEANSHFSGVPMPSNKYIDLTVGASDTEYIAPANGWFVADSYVSGNYIVLENKTIGGMRAMSLKISNTDMVCYLPVSQGDVVRLGYGGNWTPNSWQTKHFRFYYAKGEV